MFVTGNARKLQEVREILAQGTPTAIEMESRDLDRECVKLLLSPVEIFAIKVLLWPLWKSHTNWGAIFWF